MKNIIILGTGRSGTSMVTGLFRNTGAYFGDKIIAPTVANPYGYYECAKINQLNNRLIEKILAWPFTINFLNHFQPAMHRSARCFWLAAPRYIRSFKLPNEIIGEMRHFVSCTPFCLKDPRFNITLPFWYQVIPDNTRFIVVFRDPQRTVDSMLRDTKETYRPPLPLDANWGFKLWYRSYQRLLYKLSNKEEWFFLHDEQVFNGEALPALEKFAGTDIATDQIDPKVRRSHPKQFKSFNRLIKQCEKLFENLKQRSEHDVEKWVS